MNPFDRWQEIFETLARNPLRTALTSLSVAWGVFMLVVLLGAGSGLENHVHEDFKDQAVNSIWIRGGKTAKAFDGMPVGRSISFTTEDYVRLRDTTEGADHVSGRFFLWNKTVSRGKKHGSYDVDAVYPESRYLQNTKMERGRFLDAFDIAQRRKVVVIEDAVGKEIFEDQDPLGQRLDIDQMPWLVVGIFADDTDPGDTRHVFVPITTAQTAWHGSNRVNQLMFTVGDADVAQSDEIAAEVKKMLATKHRFATDDRSAIRVRNNLEKYGEITSIFRWIHVFVWLVGVGTITAGIVGVGNIMLVSVNERTREIGIRKAIGATPRSIVLMILEEAVLLTSVSGYLGLVAGVAVVETVARVIPKNDYITAPEVNFRAALVAMVVLMLFGALAGFIPARRAASVRPIEALRDQ